MHSDRTKKLLFCLCIFVVTVDVNGFSVKYDYVSATNVTRNTRQADECRPDQFRCQSGQCISQNGRCDGVFHCEDKSDETKATCLNEYCSSFAFKCGYGACLDKFKKCDGKQDCHDNSDELDCRFSPKPTVKPTTAQQQTTVGSVGCVLPSYPFNGKWEIKGISTDGLGPGKQVAYATLLQFVCDKTYQLSENGYVFCDEQGWSKNPLPTCMRKCPAMFSTQTTSLQCFDEKRNEILCTEAIDGATAKFECASYYEPTGNTYRFCWKGTWDGPPPKCIPVCGKKTMTAEPLIVNGQNVSKGEYPWTAAIYRNISGHLTNVCGGSMLSQNIILTAGHCVTDEYGNSVDPAILKVGVGQYYNHYRDPRDFQAQYSDVKEVIKQENFKGKYHRYTNDIAVLITTDTLLISNDVQPVCYSNLPQFHLNNNSIGVMTGWGYTVSDGIPSDELKAVEVPYKNDATCKEELPTELAKYMTYDKFCAGYNNRSMAVCIGDGGGGLAFKNPQDNRYYVLGIVSSAHEVEGSCNIELSSLYTRVATHYYWLERVTSQHANTVKCPALYTSHTTILQCFDERGNEILCTEAVDGTTARLECAPHYESTERTKTTWNCWNGMWDYPPPECIPAKCPAMNTTTTTIMHCFDEWRNEIPCTEATNGSLARFDCAPNYKPAERTETTRYCWNGMWDNPPPKCIPVKCSAINTFPTTISHCFDKKRNEIPCKEAVDGDTARFECAPYYEPVERTDTTRYCRTGQWNYPLPKCIPVCGEKIVSAEPLIVDGQYVSKGEYPWTVAIFRKTGENFTNVCGGSMLSQKVILTAGHCVTNEYGNAIDPSIMKVGVGKYYNHYKDPRDSHAQYSDVKKVITHEKFKGSVRRYVNDIAFLITTDILLFSEVVQPICYSNLSQFHLDNNSIGVVTGWGFTVSDGIPSEELKAVEVPYKDDATCNQELPTEWADKFMTYDKFCAGYNNRSVAVCKGDSGGGLAFKNPKDQRYYVHGIVSIAHKVDGACNIELSSLYTRVTTHYEWLEQVTSQYAISN